MSKVEHSVTEPSQTDSQADQKTDAAAQTAASANSPRVVQQLTFCLAWLLLSIAIIAADLLSKHWASNNLTLYSSQEITSWLNFHLAHNRGAAFSFLHDADGWQRWFFSSVSSIVSVILLVWLWQTPRDAWRQALALSLVLGGAIGNLVDRLYLGYVVDFIDVHYAGWHWPAFNIADAAITVGIFLLVIDGLIPRKTKDKSKG
jgi:signal peptidase II